MTLIPQEQLQNIPNLYDTENDKDPICHIKLFTPDSNWTRQRGTVYIHKLRMSKNSESLFSKL